MVKICLHVNHWMCSGLSVHQYNMNVQNKTEAVQILHMVLSFFCPLFLFFKEASMFGV